MKKLFLLAFSLFLVAETKAALLPVDTDTTLQAINISMDNQDATEVEARPGDILRYELVIKNEDTDIINYVAELDVSGITNVADIVDAGLAQINGNTLVFPPFSHEAPYQHIFVFFARVKDCSGSNLSAMVTGEAKQVSVPVSCGAAPAGPLPQTGAALYVWLGALALMLVVSLGAVFALRRS